VLIAGAFAPLCVLGTDDAAGGYAKVRPSLVKVWAFDGAGRPVESGSGIVIASDARQSYVLTAEHVVAHAARITVDVDRRVHDLVARIVARGTRDLAVLVIDRGGMPTATLAPRSRAVVEGNVVAVAGFVKHDELIGVIGQEPRLLYPGTISDRPDDGKYLELENVPVEEGLSGGAVFDPQSGDVVGVVIARTVDGRGGFADSVPLVVLDFLVAHTVAYATPAPAQRERITAHHVPPAVATPAPMRIAVATTAPAPPPIVAVSLPAPHYDPPVSRVGPASWQIDDAPARTFAYVRRACAIAVSVRVTALALAIADRALVPAEHHPLGITIRRRTGASYACSAFPATVAFEGDYEPTTSSFDGRHLTVRYAFEGARAAGDDDGSGVTFPDDGLFPSDVSLDVDLTAQPAVATLQFFDADWNGSEEITLVRADAATVAGPR